MLTCDWCISIHFVCFYVFAACDRPVSDCFRQWSTSFFRSFLWSFLFLSLARITHQSIPPAPPPPPGYCGAFACLVSPGRGWGICKFCTARGPGICQPPGHSRAFDTHAVSYQNITTQKVLLEKKQIGSSVKDRNKLKRVVKACSRFYACISSLLIKPELHSETRKLSTWFNIFWLVNQISADIIWRTSFHIYKTIYNI